MSEAKSINLFITGGTGFVGKAGAHSVDRQDLSSSQVAAKS